MSKLLVLGVASVAAGATGLGAFFLSSPKSESQITNSLSKEESSTQVKPEKRGCKILFVNSQVETTMSEDPEGEDSVKDRPIDDGSKLKIKEGCREGKTVYLQLTEEKWTFFTSK
ncbi:hypothetical protein HF1_04530 [Mycoplasma haemofelis str. Langford 1]|uniref:Uncharacterized protein n=1 Tax=Mycoplasma haemofelis (strain Langford 1) TaxID=941640 RepID=E8ZH40_MYCHL|nr:hypothetical protein [Mycoplasma haemofelis]CBY92461.1 hypothetical protein HF1_04530 [Mycoplasma haemofelis str. Langford 1]